VIIPDAPRPMRLATVTPVARATSLFAFEAVDGAPLPPATAGAHLDLHLPDELVRQYSLVLEPPAPEGGAPGRYVVAVKRDAASRGGSRWLHEGATPGIVLPVGGPRNHLPLGEDAEHTVLLAGGIGVTPIWSMMRRLEALGRPFEMHYACQAREDVAFAGELAGRPSVHVDADAGRLLDVAAICRGAPAGAHLYYCGPAPMLDAFEAATAERANDHVHFESFGARQAAAAEGGFEVELAASGATLAVPPGRRLRDPARGGGGRADLLRGRRVRFLRNPGPFGRPGPPLRGALGPGEAGGADNDGLLRRRPEPPPRAGPLMLGRASP
jgi:ferredoxin-NADP reductase